MKKRLLPLAVLGLALACCPVAFAEATVSNIRSFQQAGTKLVHIDYDLGGSGGPFWMSVVGSSDGGATWVLPVTTLTGKVGGGITVGSDQRITWNAGTDWSGQVSDLVRFRVSASDVAPSGEFVWIPGGSFLMGDSFSESHSDELPVHGVYVSGFYMACYEVTKALWDEGRDWGMSNGYTDMPVGMGKAANHPVHSIDRNALMKWCNARSEKENLSPCYRVSGVVYRTGDSGPVTCDWTANGYRLPTEAEWEKAARGGLSGKCFPWGDSITHGQVNYWASGPWSYEISATRGFHPSYNDGVFPYTSPVGSFAPNGYGIYDMAGNVWEWCWDWHGSYRSDSQIDPHGPASGPIPIIRGGAWNDSGYSARCAYRYSYSPVSYDDFGFRLARSQ